MRSKPKETPVDLTLWIRNGCLGTGNDPKAPDVHYPQVEIGRTDSKRRLGFAIQMAKDAEWILFTFDRVQVENLRHFFAYQIRRMKGRRQGVWQRMAEAWEKGPEPRWPDR